MSTSKAIKNIILTATAQEHHTRIKFRNILRWVKSGHEVKVTISGKADRHKAMDEMLKQLERDLKSGASLKQKVVKPDSIKFFLRPTPEAANIDIDEETEEMIENVDDITAGKDIFSEEFVKELDQSIREDRSKGKKR